MCIYLDVFGSGAVLWIQAATALAIALSVVFWAWAYGKAGLRLRAYVLPIALWILFGTLDAIATAKGTYGDPMRELNPLTRFALVQWGDWGLPIASVLWISFWAGLALLLERRGGKKAGPFLALAVFYGLAAGHLFGFSSWFVPLCPLARLAPPSLSCVPGIILAGAGLAALHMLAVRRRIL
jgi:hypothetical protein